MARPLASLVAAKVTLNPHSQDRHIDWIRTKAPFVAEYASG